MKKISAFVIFFSILIGQGKAQIIKGFVIFGTNASQIDGDEVSGFKHWGINAGLGSMMAFNNKSPWNVSIETLISQKGSYEKRLYIADLTYAEVPALFHYVDKRGGFTFGAGIAYGRLINLKENPSINFKDSTTSFEKNNLSILADIRFAIWKQLKLDLRYQYSLIPIRRDWVFTNINGKAWTRNAYDHTLTLRLLWVFNEKMTPQKKRRR